MSLGRMIVSRQEVLNEMRKTDFHNEDAVKRFARLTDAVTAPEFEYDRTVPVLTPRQWCVARDAFVYAIDHDLDGIWWEMLDFVDAVEGENMNQIELQVLCLMLEAWIAIADAGKPIVIQ